ncbi:hypothetical protein [Sodalis-like endosymbiont of Proechinophthirus fluctus]|uniref:hypothetical protein n=1 Tax=Sodalis-like endosymbiont of Proechinophthirus fluctus TaxID=1462730 RepID=UPI00164F7FC0|nr:hypothetical protein [Sodalis-like endosymbiont of Proechinophthirus fluctus]
MFAARSVDSTMSLFFHAKDKKLCKSVIGNMGYQKLVSSEHTDDDVVTIVHMTIAKLTPVKPDNFASIESQPKKALRELINELAKLTADDKMQLREYIKLFLQSRS